MIKRETLAAVLHGEGETGVATLIQRGLEPAALSLTLWRRIIVLTEDPALAVVATGISAGGSDQK